MSQHSRKIGWCLLTASILTWCGCDALWPHHEVHQVHHSWEEIKPPLPGRQQELPDPSIKPQLPEEPASPPRLLPPVVERHLPEYLEPQDPQVRAAFMQMLNLHRQACESYSATPLYTARLRRREMVDGKLRPEEEIQIKYRKEPASLALHWLGNENKNRVVLYVKGRNDDMLHIVPGFNDALGFPGLNYRPILRPDSAKGLGKEHYPVCETGVGSWINRFGQLVSALDRGDPTVGTAKFLGLVTRPEFEAPVNAVMHIVPPGVDGWLPKGGQRLWYFDASLRFPVLIIGHDALGHEIEYFCFDRFLFPERIPDEEFDPTRVGRR